MIILPNIVFAQDIKEKCTLLSQTIKYVNSKPYKNECIKPHIDKYGNKYLSMIDDVCDFSIEGINNGLEISYDLFCKQYKNR